MDTDDIDIELTTELVRRKCFSEAYIHLSGIINNNIGRITGFQDRGTSVGYGSVLQHIEFNHRDIRTCSP